MRRKKLNIKRYEYRDKEYIEIRTSNNKLIKKFEFKQKAKNFSNINKTKYANEKTILNYYKNKSKEVYNPTTEKEKNKQLSILINKNKFGFKDIHTFKNGNKLFFTNHRKVKAFDYTYISIKVRIKFDGHDTTTTGRSNYVYGRYIRNDEINYFVHQALMRALAPYGSNLSFKMIDYNFVYHQDRFNNLYGLEDKNKLWKEEKIREFEALYR